MSKFDLLDDELDDNTADAVADVDTSAPAPAAAPARGGSKFALLDELDPPAPKARVVDPRFVDNEEDTSRRFANTGPDLAGQMKAESAENRKRNERPGLVERAKNMVTGLAETAKGGARELKTAYDRGILETLADPHHRREFERGLSDMITFGGAEALGNKVSDVFDSPDTSLRATAQGDRAAAPDARALGNAVGMVSPGAATAVAKGVGAATKIAAGAAPGVVSRVIASRPFTGAAQGAGVTGAATLGQEVSAGVPLGEAIADAGDQALSGGLLGGAVGAAASAPGAAGKFVEQRAAGAAGRIADRTREALGDGTGIKLRRNLAAKADEVDALVSRHPEIEKLADKPKKLVPRAEDLIAAKNEQLRIMDEERSKATGVGGIRLGDMLESIEKTASEAEKDPGAVKVADAIRGEADAMKRSWGEDPDAVIPTVAARRFASTLQKRGYSFKTEGTAAEAAQESSKAILDSVNKRMTGLGYAEGIESKDPQVRKYYETNDDLTALRRIVAAAEAKNAAPAGATGNRLRTMLRGVRHGAAVTASAATHSPLPIVADLALSHGLPAASRAADRVLVKTQGLRSSIAGLADKASPVADILSDKAARVTAGAGEAARDRALARIVQGAESGENPDELRRQAQAEGVDPDLVDNIRRRFFRQVAHQHLNDVLGRINLTQAP